jgi:hypothetical protein
LPKHGILAKEAPTAAESSEGEEEVDVSIMTPVCFALAENSTPVLSSNSNRGESRTLSRSNECSGERKPAERLFAESSIGRISWEDFAERTRGEERKWVELPGEEDEGQEEGQETSVESKLRPPPKNKLIKRRTTRTANEPFPEDREESLPEGGA